MKIIKTPIIPHKPTFVKVKGEQHAFDYKAICVFSALGFFLDTDTYWLDEKVLPPASINKIDKDNYWLSSEPWFQWHYTPQDINLETAVANFSKLFEKLVKEQSEGNNVILPLSGGLDSRSQAVALKKVKANVKSYSYSFENGYKESKISKKIAQKCAFDFSEFTVGKSYLWDCIEELSQINQCYSEFTHPRQMAVINEVANLGDHFSLGHWGDVLFDADKYSDTMKDQELLLVLKKKIIKKGGLELANSLWKNWELEGDFETYLNTRILKLLKNINIDNANAKLRAFKSMYWAPRWTSVNLSVFESRHAISLPYYSDEMCEFICTLPEDLLANRKIQIEYIKKTNPGVAKILWQDARPFHLFNHHLAKFPYNFPYRVINKLQRMIDSVLGKKHTQRNWELQFLGNENRKNLERYLFANTTLESIKKEIITEFLDLFYTKDGVYYSHSVSTLLTLSFVLKKER